MQNAMGTENFQEEYSAAVKENKELSEKLRKSFLYLSAVNRLEDVSMYKNAGNRMSREAEAIAEAIAKNKADIEEERNRIQQDFRNKSKSRQLVWEAGEQSFKKQR